MHATIKKYLQTKTPEAKSILWMLCSCFFSSLMATITKHVSTSMPPLEMVFFRNFFSVACILPWALTHGIPHIKAANFRLYFSRSLSSLFAMSVFFYSISIIPLTDAIALTFAVPLITTVFAYMFLGENVSLARCMALIVGFAGVIIIVRPGHNGFQYASLMVLGATIFWSVSNILIKKLSHTDHPRAMVFIMMLIMTPLTLPGALYVWQTPHLNELAWLVLLSICTNEAQFCMNKAYKNSQISLVMPFDFSRLIFTIILAYIFFAEIIDLWTLIGSLIIFSSSVYIASREARLRRKKEFHEILDV
jgi:drug/metabolite transporter (DMT)-like permease